MEFDENDKKVLSRITCITGGARSGKSSYALDAAVKLDGKKGFIATAQACDHEMEKRIADHKSERGDSFVTIEEPLALSSVIDTASLIYDVLVVDCLTVWLANIYYHTDNDIKQIEHYIKSLGDVLQKVNNTLFIITNEVGWGIVPEGALARSYRDYAGHLNKVVAYHADQVVLMVSGIPVMVKG